MKIFICALLYFILMILLNYDQSMGSKENLRIGPKGSRQKVPEESRRMRLEDSRRIGPEESRQIDKEQSRRMRLAESRRRSLEEDRRIAAELRHSTLNEDCYVYFNDRPLRVPPGGMIHQIQRGIFIPDVAFLDPINLIAGDVIRRRGELFAKVFMEGERQIIYRYYQGALTGPNLHNNS
ncbi:uncharacterized protein LOC117178525 [Belonocnema kinseyi]|uniref:uncharacterized protein LOC117178525 n=1 Tax=Belonocnema kinseyi TaxID=2817044 RepID=UPI00143D6DE1|nr:uncharacterized protein LOC117178525 [Belonocnema kinseyi]